MYESSQDLVERGLTTHAKILADSISPYNIRFTTMEVTFPRFMLAEFNTHSVLSRNSASSRAIPPEKLISRVQEHPFVPLTFNKRVKGMGVGAALEGGSQNLAKSLWLDSRNAAVSAAQKLNLLDVDKSRVNRLLEPFMWHTAIVSATEWENFFALRDHPDAQPEFQLLASMMREAMEQNIPHMLEVGDWHLPLEDHDDLMFARAQHSAGHIDSYDEGKKVSAGRCARVSYLTQHGVRDRVEDVAMCDRLASSGHMSPLEHQATPVKHVDSEKKVYDFNSDEWLRSRDWRDKLYGWQSFRYEQPHQENFGEVRCLQDSTEDN